MKRVSYIVYDIITMGSATVDVFANTSSELVKFVTAKGEKDYITYPSGSKILIKELQFLIGGGGTNTAVSFSRLGFKTGFLGKVGDDANGVRVIDSLQKEQIDFLGKKDGQTGFSIILDSIERDRTILTFKGTNDELQEEDIPFEQLQTKWLYSSSLVGTSFDTLAKVFRYAKSKGIKIAFNPSSYQAKLGMAHLQNVLSCCDVVILNYEEAQLLTGELDSIDQLAIRIAQGQSRIVVITDGPKGATCYANEKTYHIYPSEHVDVVETTGAGDAFASGFVSGLMYNFDISDCLKLGLVQAESVIQHQGAKQRLLPAKEALHKMHTYKGDISEYEAEEIVESITSYASIVQGIDRSVPFEKHFILQDGRRLSSIEELAYFLHFGGQVDYDLFVKDGENHFANWVASVLHLETLALTMKATQNKDELSAVLLTYIRLQRRK